MRNCAAGAAAWPQAAVDRARIDDLALTLYHADTEFGQTTSGDRITALRPLVRAYTSRLDDPRSGAEYDVLPWAIARQPLWGTGGWSHCSMTSAPPGPTPAQPSPPSSAPSSWSPTSRPGSKACPNGAPNAQL